MRFAPELELTRGSGPRPAGVRVLRVFGAGTVLVFLATSLLARPYPAFTGDGRWALLCLVVLVVGLPVGIRPRPYPPGVRMVVLLVDVAATLGLILVQGMNSSGIAGIYFACVFGALRLPRNQAVVVAVAAIGGGALTYGLGVPESEGQVISILMGVPPWFIIVRILRALRIRGHETDALIEELRESREAQAAAATQAERGRVARDLHDVLAHSLSALSLQLEAARLLALDRGADDAVVREVERAHHLAASGLDEARGAIGALRGEELPGPERLPALADTFRERSAARCDVTVTGAPLALGAEARVALYRTAQEALTNVRKHAAPDRVDIGLAYAPDGVTLTVRDVGRGTPVTVGAGGGYGLTGMRERAELLGGRLEAGPTDDGFCVELWLPAAT